jgi:hypothetical protein
MALLLANSFKAPIVAKERLAILLSSCRSCRRRCRDTGLHMLRKSLNRRRHNGTRIVANMVPDVGLHMDAGVCMVVMEVAWVIGGGAFRSQFGGGC